MSVSSPDNKRIVGFAPVSTVDAHSLILGSMPGEDSLRLAQYYANPRNAFWRIISRHSDKESDLSYEGRLKMLSDHGIALWDVLHSCQRSGSLDSSIRNASVITNDFAGFFASHPGIRRIFFNGAFAEASYRKHVLPTLDALPADIAMTRLPSTSPANASLGFEAKLQAWRVIFERCP